MSKATITKPSWRVREIINQRKKRIGALGEALVKKHLVSKGFDHIVSNYLKRQGELDLVMQNGQRIHFIEVKTVSREKFVNVIHETFEYRPEENVNLNKLRKIGNMVQIFLSEKHLQDREWQFDVAVVYLDKNALKAHIKLIKDIPLAG